LVRISREVPGVGNLGGKEESIMRNNYESPEVNEVGRAQDVILGSTKDINIVEDGASQPKRLSEELDDEE
jgi:hypothetical protein